MNGHAWDGHDLLAALRHSTATLQAEVDEVDALNVFPIPDGDTGSNMLATLQAAVAEADRLVEHERSVPRVAAAMSSGALMGARGNSGVILSQVFKGLGNAVAGVEFIAGRELAEALRQGYDAAFASVSEPVDGTILTVARDAAAAAARSVDQNGSLDHVLDAAVSEAAAAVARTPGQLPLLARAGVVDAGGRGLELILRGALAAVRGEPLPHAGRLHHDVALPLMDEPDGPGYGYETIFMVSPAEGGQLDLQSIRTTLATLGESVLVAGDPQAAKVHIHNEQPDAVLAFGLTLGTLSRISIENLDERAVALREAALLSALPARGPAPGSVDGAVVVAVAPGDGWAKVFASLGATAMVDGGQGANPSAGEIADAVRGTAAGEAIVLTNNPNVRLAALQAAELSPDVEIRIVATRNPAEGVTALLARRPGVGLIEMARAMESAVAQVQTLEVTRAVRDATVEGRRVRRGQFMVLAPADSLKAVGDDRTKVVVEAVRGLEPGFELVTVYRGRDVGHAAAEQLRAALSVALEDVEIELVDGGQPHYDFLIAAE